MAKTIMIQGTCSNAGKSLLAAGICRILKEDGYRVAPFKAQNMALNSFITKDGLEMGKSPGYAGGACRIEPDCRMNPILLETYQRRGVTGDHLRRGLRKSFGQRLLPKKDIFREPSRRLLTVWRRNTT